MNQTVNRMFVKFLRVFPNPKKFVRKTSAAGGGGKEVVARRYSDMVPPTQYDIPIPRRLQIGYVLKEYWETIPLFVTTAVSMGLLFAACVYAARNKVDVVFSTHSRENISRTMDLRNPTVHKVIIINQRYEPWPEMQDVLDKMRDAEKRALVRAQTCSFA